MIIDVNAYVGHYPFRKTKYKTAADLIGLMDTYGIDVCCVSPLEAIYYKDAMQANLDLLEEIAPYGGRLVPFCVINPEYNHAAEDFKSCVNELGFAGLRLFPKQHGYDLSGEASVKLLLAAGELKIPTHIPLLLEDLRGHAPMDINSPVGVDEIERAARSAPDTDFILSNDYLDSFARELEPMRGERAGRIYYDIGRIDCLYFKMMENLIKEAGYDRILFGTGAVLQNITVQFVKLHYMGRTVGATQDDIEKITSGNLMGLFGEKIKLSGRGN